jgi:hypothetical protein
VIPPPPIAVTLNPVQLPSRSVVGISKRNSQKTHEFS